MLAITGNGVTSSINNTLIGNVTPLAGTFTTLNVTTLLNIETGSISIKPVTVGSLDNVIIGGTTPLASTFTKVTITQTPATCSLAQSPTIFTAAESGLVYTSASFQYYLDLYYWNGTPNNSGSIPNYTLVKYPNISNVGIFDVSRILNSTLTSSLQANPSNVKYFAADIYTSYLSSSVFVTIL